MPAAALTVHAELRAEQRDVAHLVGTIAVECRTVDGPTACPASYRFTNALAGLPDPKDDRTRARTWPDREDRAHLWYTHPADPGAPVIFGVRLPHRYGDVGWLGRGSRARTYANGGWYPQLVDEVDGVQRPVIVDWDVTVEGPGVVVVNGAVGRGVSHWSGTADRVGLAILPHGRVRADPGNGLTLVDLPGLTPTSHPLGHRLLDRIAPSTVDAPAMPALGTALSPVTVVQDTDLLHLARPAPGMVYLSDRAFRLVWLGRPYHARGVRQALLSASTPLPDGWERDFVADALARSLPAPDLRRTLGWLAWNPVVDALLNDGTLPFYDDVFASAFDADPALVDRLDGHISPRAAGRQLDDLLGEGSALAEARRMLSGAPADAADPVPPTLRRSWGLPYDPDQDYRIETKEGRPVAVLRTASPDAPVEVVRVTADGATHAWLTGRGSDALSVVDRRHVSVDSAHLAEQNRANDRWPVRWDVILSAGIYGLSPTQGNLDAWGELVLRPHGDTHNLGLGALEHDEEDLVSASIGYLRSFGPLLNRQQRTEHVRVMVDGSWLDPAFRPTTSGALALGGALGWSWDTRDSGELSGHRLSAGLAGGFVPGSTDRWASVGLGGTLLLPLGPRQVLATRAKAGWASGDVAHRLLTLGGTDDLRSTPESLFVGNEKLIANLEYRLALFRNAQIPLPLLWGSELQLAPGAELGAAWTNSGEQLTVAGASLGVHAIYDALGARPMLAGATVAVPVWSTSPWWSAPEEGLQVYIDFAQGF